MFLLQSSWKHTLVLISWISWCKIIVHMHLCAKNNNGQNRKTAFSAKLHREDPSEAAVSKINIWILLWSFQAYQVLNSLCSSCSSFSFTHLLLGGRGLDGGPVVSPSCFLSSCGPPDPSRLMGHWPTRANTEPHQRKWLCVQLLLPAPSAQHEREKAWLSCVASCPGAATQDLKLPCCSV